MKVTIIGAGIAGLSTAIALRKFRPDLELVVYEGGSELRAVGAGLLLGANAVLGFDQLGLKDEVLSVSNVLHFFRIQDSQGRLITQSDNLTINRNLQTISNFSVHRADLQRLLLAQLSDVTVYLNKRVQEFSQDPKSVRIRFADGTEITTDYVVATDGIHSVFRRTLLPEVKLRYAGYTCWRGVTGGNVDRPSDAFESGLRQDNVASEIWGAGKRFGIVPLPNGRVYWFACVNASARNDPRMAGFGKKQLVEIFGALHAPIAQLIERTDSNEVLWNDILDFPPVKRFAFERVLLLGDAAHATTPNLGQGACQAIEGAVILGKTLASNLDPGAAFVAFERRRLKRTTSIVNRSWQLGKVAQLANPLLAGLRDFALRRIPPSVNERQVKELLDVAF